MAKINISIDDELLTRIDELADSSYSSRSGLISMVMADYVKSKELLATLNSMNASISKIASSGSIDNETQKELDTFKSLCALVARN